MVSRFEIFVLNQSTDPSNPHIGGKLAGFNSPDGKNFTQARLAKKGHEPSHLSNASRFSTLVRSGISAVNMSADPLPSGLDQTRELDPFLCIDGG